MTAPFPADGPVVLLGGTFDPVHFGHLRTAEEVRRTLGAERFLLVPSGEPPHRPTPRTPAAHRLAMAEAAVMDRPEAAVLGWEVAAEGPSYTVRMLEWLRERLGNRSVSIIVGSDAFTGLHQWHQWPRLLELAHIVTVRRPGTGWTELESPLAEAVADRWTDDPAVLARSAAGAVLALEVTRLDISATAIRAGAGPAFLVPSNVEHYIDTHDLYRHREETAHDG